jgi:DNA-binding GntR family transcriptional regulator
MAAVHATDTEIARLRDAVSLDVASLDGGKDAIADLYERHDRDFHVTIARCGRNPMLTDLLCAELYPLLRLYRGMPAGTRPPTHRAVVEHERIVSAIEDRDPDLAEVLMRRHISAARGRRETALAEAALAATTKP